MKNRYSIHNFETKLILSFVLVAVIPVLVVISIFYFETSNSLLNTILVNEEHDLSNKKKNIDIHLDNIEGDVLFLSSLTSVQGYASIDNVDSSDALKENIEDDFLSFSKRHSSYFQIRYLNEDGDEVVRVDLQDGNSTILAQESLQNKESRYYFSNTINLKDGEVYVSPLDLNVEQGVIEDKGTNDAPEYVPAIRYSTPVYNSGGVNKGIIIINVSANDFLKLLDEEDSLNEEVGAKEIYLVNKEGYYLHNPDKNLEWGFQLGNESTVYDYCVNAHRIFENDEGQFFSEETDCYITYFRIYPSTKRIDSSDLVIGGVIGEETVYDDQYWVLFSRIKGETIFKSTINTIYESIALVVILLVVILLVSLYISRSIYKPVEKLKKGAKEISKGNFDYKVKVTGQDDMADLLKAFNEMTEKLRDSKSNVELKVEDRTKDLQNLNDAMVNREIKMIQLKKELDRCKKKKK